MTRIVLSVLVLAVTALGCTSPIVDSFGRTTWDEVPEDERTDGRDDEAPADEGCWGVRGTLDMPGGSNAPYEPGETAIMLFEADQVSPEGYPIGGVEPIDLAGGPGDSLPQSFQLCYEDGMEYREVVIVAMLDVDGDDEYCDDGDFVGWARFTVDGTESSNVDVALESVIYGLECGDPEE